MVLLSLGWCGLNLASNPTAGSAAQDSDPARNIGEGKRARQREMTMMMTVVMTMMVMMCCSGSGCASDVCSHSLFLFVFPDWKLMSVILSGGSCWVSVIHRHLQFVVVFVFAHWNLVSYPHCISDVDRSDFTARLSPANNVMILRNVSC